MDRLLEEISVVASKVNSCLQQLSSSHAGGLSDAAFHLIKLGGKRLRPFLLVKCCELVGGDVEDALPAAVSIELLHNFTLIHDDVMDRDDFRRGAPTVHRVYGEPAAIIAGDMLFALVFNYASQALARRGIPSSTTQKVLDALSEAAIVVCEGQWMDMDLQNKGDIPEETYLSLITKKTGKLYQTPAVIGGIVGGADEDSLRKLSSFGEIVGQAFQIADDLLGAVGDPKVTGKPVGSDLRNGKSTIIVIHGLRESLPQDRNGILEVFGKQDASEEEILGALKVLESIGSIDYARRRARQLSEQAKEELSYFADSDSRSLLNELCDFVVSRSF